MTTKKNEPVHRIRYGPVNATIWANKTLAGCFFNTTFRRSFKQPDDTWSESDSFDDRDLPALAKAASDAHSWIHEAKANPDMETLAGLGDKAAVLTEQPRLDRDEPNSV